MPAWGLFGFQLHLRERGVFASLSPAELRVLNVMISYADTTGNVWEGLTMALLAKATGVDARTARRAIRRLEAAVGLRVTRGRGRGQASRYTLPYPHEPRSRRNGSGSSQPVANQTYDTVVALLCDAGLTRNVAESIARLPTATPEQVRVSLRNADHVEHGTGFKKNRVAYLINSVRNAHKPYADVALSEAREQAKTQQQHAMQHAATLSDHEFAEATTAVWASLPVPTQVILRDATISERRANSVLAQAIYAARDQQLVTAETN